MRSWIQIAAWTIVASTSLFEVRSSGANGSNENRREDLMSDVGEDLVDAPKPEGLRCTLSCCGLGTAPLKTISIYLHTYIVVVMGTLTVRISDEIEKSLRRRAAQLYGAKKGALSRAIEDAIRSWLSSTPGTSVSTKEQGRIYRAFKGEKLIAEASTLEELANRLREKGESVRGLRIVREPAPVRERNLGLRTGRATT